MGVVLPEGVVTPVKEEGEQDSEIEIEIDPMSISPALSAVGEDTKPLL